MMGSRNRERRKAKQKARAGRSRPPAVGQQPEAGLFQQERRQRELLRETVDTLIAAALNAQLAQDDAALAEYVELLVAARSGPGGHTVDRSLAGWSDRIIEAIWQRGWQPVDVHRIVSRRAVPRQARLAVDAVAAQMRQYAAATVDERCDAQLRALDATVWWDHDDNRLDAWGEREGRGRAEVLVDTLGLLDLLHTLPAIESLCPQPGTVRRGAPGQGDGRGHTPAGSGSRAAGAGSGRSADPRILDKVRALLAKAESTGFAEEADALTAKAQQMMARHSIDEALLAAREKFRDKPAGCRVGIDNPYEAAKASLLDVVASANRCRCVWAKNLGFATVIGFQPDLDAVELLYTSLLVQATAAMMQAGSRQDRHGRSRTRSFRQSFLTSFAVRIGQRLTAATEQAGAEAAAETGGGQLLPVLAARNDSVREATETMFPQLVSRTVSATDGEGWAFGRAAADLASLRARDEVTADPPG